MSDDTLVQHRIDAVEAGGETGLATWSAKPRPLFAEMGVRDLHRPQGPRSGLNALVGMWPGDETEDEIFRRPGGDLLILESRRRRPRAARSS